MLEKAAKLCDLNNTLDKQTGHNLLEKDITCDIFLSYFCFGKLKQTMKVEREIKYEAFLSAIFRPATNTTVASFKFSEQITKKQLP